MKEAFEIVSDNYSEILVGILLTAVVVRLAYEIIFDK